MEGNTTVVFARGLKLRPARLTETSIFDCVFGYRFDKPRLLLSTRVVSAAHEVLRKGLFCKNCSCLLCVHVCFPALGDALSLSFLDFFSLGFFLVVFIFETRCFFTKIEVHFVVEAFGFIVFCLGLLKNLREAPDFRFFSRFMCLKIFGFHELGTEWLRSTMKNMDQLEELIIDDFPRLVSISDLLKQHPLPKLRIMHIGCLSSCRVPTRQWRRSLTCSLVINSIKMSNKLNGLVNLSSRLDALIINLFPGLDSLPEWIQLLHQLEYLVIEDSENLTHLPNWLSKLSKLKRFRLTRLPELSSLPDAVGSLSQLEGLYIHSCPKLNFLPDGVQHLSRLHYLYISQCDALVERCQKEDKHKISHIPDLFLV